MGCGESTQIKEEVPEILDLSNFDNIQKFEHSLPFYRTRIDIFEGKIKRFVNAKTSVSLA